MTPRERLYYKNLAWVAVLALAAMLVCGGVWKIVEAFVRVVNAD